MEVPNSFYYILGVLIIANLGTIGSVMFFAFRAVWWLSKLESKVDKNLHDVNAAHDKIRDLGTRMDKIVDRAIDS